MKPLQQQVAGLKLGDTILVDAGRLEHARCSAHKRGMKLHIVHRNIAGKVLMQRVAETRWGAVKNVVAKMEMGQSIQIPAGKRDVFAAAAYRLGIHLARGEVIDGVATMTRVANPAPRAKIKLTILSLMPGETLRAPNQKRALCLCAAACGYGLRLSRAHISTGEYILTRVA